MSGDLEARSRVVVSKLSEAGSGYSRHVDSSGRAYYVTDAALSNDETARRARVASKPVDVDQDILDEMQRIFAMNRYEAALYSVWQIVRHPIEFAKFVRAEYRANH